MSKSHSLNAVHVGVALALYGGAAVAASEDSDKLEEIVVTSSRRASTVLDTPYAIQAISGQDLERAGITDINGLTQLAPGLSMFGEGARVSGNRNSFNIRGLNAGNAYNNDDNPSLNQPAVSTYFGETPVFFPFKLVDIERIEVMKGPQGTLYGGSSIGGTVRFIPAPPDPTALTAQLNAEVSKTDHAASPGYDWSLTLNVPLNDRNAVRATIGHQYLSGFIDADRLVRQTGTAMNPGSIVLADPANPLTSPPAAAGRITDYNMADLDFFRSAFLSQITDSVKVTLNLAYQQNKAEGRNEDNPYYGSGQNYQFYKAFTDPQDSTMKLYDVDVEADLGFATLTSATAMTNLYTKSASDSSGYLRTNLASYYAGYPRLYVPIERNQHVDGYSEEVRLASKPSTVIDWLAGVFAQSTHTSFRLEQDAPGLNDYTNAVFGLADAPLNFTDVLATGYTSTTFNDYALFGEVTWHITSRWDLTGGARVFHDTLKGVSGTPLPYASLTTQYFEEGVATNPYLLGGYYQIESTTNDRVFKASTSYHLNDVTMAYGTFSQGFRPGGANALPLSDVLGDNNRPYLSYKPDTVNNYELGIKGGVGKRFTYVADVYLVDWKDFQATLYTPFGVNYIANVAPARSQGAELELKAELTRSLSVGINYTYIDAYTRRGFDMEAGMPSTFVPAGSRLPGSSKNVYSTFAEYTQAVGVSALVFRIDESYRSHAQSNFVNLPEFAADNFVPFSPITIWNSSLTLIRDPFTIALYGQNLSNNRGTSVATSATDYGERDQGYGVIRPRTFGLRFSYQYR